MKWLVFAGLNIVTLSIYSFLSKILAKRVSTPLRVFIMSIGIILITFTWFFYTLKTGSKLTFDKNGLILSAFGGLVVGVAMVALQMMFAAGAPLAIGNLVARVGVIILGAVLGIVVLKEPLTLRIIAGFGLAISGLYLLLAR